MYEVSMYNSKRSIIKAGTREYNMCKDIEGG